MKKAVGAELGQSLPQPSEPKDDYQMEDDMRTMHSAAKIAADPAKLKKVHKLAGRRHKALTGMIEPLLKVKAKVKSLDDLKALANSKGRGMGPDEDDQV